MAYRINNSAIRGNIFGVHRTRRAREGDSAFLLCVMMEDATFTRVYPKMSVPSTGLQRGQGIYGGMATRSEKQQIARYRKPVCRTTTQNSVYFLVCATVAVDLHELAYKIAVRNLVRW